MNVNYLIVGGGLAGISAGRKIRELDSSGSILIIGNEAYYPYNRPPLTKDLWLGKKKVKDIFVENVTFFQQKNIQIELQTTASHLDIATKKIITSTGKEYFFDKLLLATGGTPRKFSIPATDLPELCYYRYISDYLKIKESLTGPKKVAIVGSGFIGSEIAAALNANGADVILITTEPYIGKKIYPPDIGNEVNSLFSKKGIRIYSEDSPVAFSRKGGKSIIHTRSGIAIEADIIIAGLGIEPNITIAQNANLNCAKGIIVNDFLQTSHPDIFAAGDVAIFPYSAIDKKIRVEHWDNALNQGLLAGSNMVQCSSRYTYMPYFFSDLFDIGYEAVGDINSELEVFADWEDKYKRGVLYYLLDNRVRGILTWNRFGKMDIAREIIKSKIGKKDLKGAIS